MKALVYDGVGKIAFLERPKPTLVEPTDAIVKVTKTTICGTDLHILKGDVAPCHPGRILGHEGVGIIEPTGSGVSTFKRGDRVLISCITAGPDHGTINSALDARRSLTDHHSSGPDPALGARPSPM